MEILGGKVESIRKFPDVVYNIRTKSTSFRVSSEHPLMISKWKKYTKSGEFRGNPQWVTAQECYQHYQNKKSEDSRWWIEVQGPEDFDIKPIVPIGEDFAKLLGYLFSDGSFSAQQSAKFTNVRESLLSDVAYLTASCFGTAIDPKRVKKGNAHDLLLTNLYSYHGPNPLKERLDILGLNTKSGSFGPLQGLRLGELVAFIQGYFNGDGSLYTAHSKYSRTPSIRFYTGVSEQNAMELQFMLWRLEVKSTIGYVNRKPGVFEGCWEVRVQECSSVKQLLDLLDDRKYPEKFKAAREALSHIGQFNTNSKSGNSLWVPVTGIDQLGIHTVVGWETNPSHEITLHSGFRTHNSGKTQLLTATALREAERGRTVYINYPLTEDLQRDNPEVWNRIHYVEDVNQFLAQRRILLQENPLLAGEEGKDLLILDEAWEYANARRSMSNASVDFVGYLRIARKMGFEVFASMQLKSSVDKTLRTLATKQILAERHKYFDTHQQRIMSYYEYTIFHSEGWDTFYITPEQAEKIHKYYLTTALQTPGFSAAR